MVWGISVGVWVFVAVADLGKVFENIMREGLRWLGIEKDK
jgi:hypothetical protein